MKANILVVDDDSAIRGLLSEVLSSNGYKVTEAENPGSVQKSLAGEQPDIVVLDVKLGQSKEEERAGLDLFLRQTLLDISVDELRECMGVHFLAGGEAVDSIRLLRLRRLACRCERRALLFLLRAGLRFDDVPTCTKGQQHETGERQQGRGSPEACPVCHVVGHG